MDKKIYLILLLFPLQLMAQEECQLRLEEVIDRAVEQSLKSKSVDYSFQSNQWQFVSFRKSYLPEISMSGTLPSLNRSLDKITQPDGTDSFQSRSQATSNVKLDVSQKIGLTGGTISLFSSLERIDLFADPETTNWLSVPVSLAIVQPLFQFNSMKWELREQPLMNEQARLKYSEDKEEVAKQACNLFYELLSSQKILEMAEQNMNYNDTIFVLSQGRFEMGKIAENELLQIELAKLNSEIRYEQSKLRMEVNNLKLMNYLGMIDDVQLRPVFEDTVPNIEINYGKAMEMAAQHNSAVIGMELQRLQGEKQIEQAKANKRINVDLFAQYGLSQQTDQELGQVYETPQDNQLLQVGFRLPITSWGAGIAEYKAAMMSNSKLQADYQMAVLSFQEQVFEKIKSFEIQKSQLSISKKANEVAEKRYFIAQKRYLIGKINTTDLNIATQERDQARTDYINTVKGYWNSYYEIRKLTHYDFIKDEVIDYSFDVKEKEKE